MIRVDHVTDPARFLLAMAVCRAVDAQASPLAWMFSLVPVVAERVLGPDPLQQGPRAARPQPCPA